MTGSISREGYLEAMTDREWNDSQPIYRQLRDRVVAMILDGVLKEGDPLPSVRIVWLRRRRFRPQGQGWRSSRSAFHSADTTRSGEVPERPESMARTAGCRGMPRGGGPAAPLSRTHLIPMRIIQKLA